MSDDKRDPWTLSKRAVLLAPFAVGGGLAVQHIVYFTTGIRLAKRSRSGRSEHLTGGAREWPEALAAFMVHVPEIIGFSVAVGLAAAVIYVAALKEQQRRRRRARR